MNNSTWIPSSSVLSHDIPFSEVFAMHIENQIRKEHKIGLRDSYITTDNEYYLLISKVINASGQSLYYDQNGRTTYNYVLPSQRFKY